jgi:FKBP-type peptidyl-prolyl cis-trans isomerase FklB
MKPLMIILLCVAAGVVGCSVSSSTTPAEPEIAMGAMSQQQELSYGIGFYLGRETRQGVDADGVGIDVQLVIQGYTDGISEKDPMFDEEELADLMYAVHEEMQARTAKRLLAENAEFKQMHDENLKKSVEFAADFGQLPGAVSMTNGLKYRELKAGQGPKPGPEDTVVCTYTLGRIDGTVFQTEDRRVFELDDVVEGASAVLQLMNEGAQWEILMPPHLAYGAVGKPPHIEPNETLVIVAELVEVK